MGLFGCHWPHRLVLVCVDTHAPTGFVLLCMEVAVLIGVLSPCLETSVLTDVTHVSAEVFVSCRLVLLHVDHIQNPL